MYHPYEAELSPRSTQLDGKLNNDILVLTVKKGFWASRDCEIFPNRIYSKYIFHGFGKWGTSRNPFNSLSLILTGYLYCLFYKPKLLLFGSAPRVSAWFARIKRRGLLPEVKLIAPGAVYLDDKDAAYFDRLYVFSRSEVTIHDPALRHKFEFIPLPAEGEFNFLMPEVNRNCIFAGGGAGRDFASLIEAVQGLETELEIVTFSQKNLGYARDLPENCKVYWRMSSTDYLKRMASALFVVVPLKEGLHPHGHTSVVQALRLGKAIISVKNASIEDYVQHGKEGLLVQSGDVDEYKQAILHLFYDHSFRASCEYYSKRWIPELSYASYARRLENLCIETLLH